jgi:hypothetical protein
MLKGGYLADTGVWTLMLTHARKVTRGYDPSKDILWLRGEIVSWIRGNLMEKWFVRLAPHITVFILTSCKGFYQEAAHCDK